MSILSALAEVGRIFKDKASQRALDNGLNNISKAFSIGSPQQDGAVSYIEIKVSHPAAAAFEYGSGIHATKGKKGLYPIKAKGADPLHFFWKERGKWFIGMELPFGHPGVEARPYLQPTAEENRTEFKKILGRGFKEEVLVRGNKVEVIEVK